MNILLPFEQRPNPYITPSLNFEFHYFFMRKLWFAYLAKALVVFPGGFGTLDEMFEILTLAQTQKLAKKITVLIYGSGILEEGLQPRSAGGYRAPSRPRTSISSNMPTRPNRPSSCLTQRINGELSGDRGRSRPQRPDPKPRKRRQKKI